MNMESWKKEDNFNSIGTTSGRFNSTKPNIAGTPQSNKRTKQKHVEDIVYTRIFLGRLRRYRVLSETLTHVYLQDMDHNTKSFNVPHAYLKEHYTKHVRSEEEK